MIVQLGLEFVRQGHEVTLAAAADYRPVEQQDFPMEILYFRSAMPKVFLPTVLPLHPQLIHFIRKNRKRFDLIISSEVFSFNSLFAACLSPGNTIVWQESGKHNRKFLRIPSFVWYNVVARLFMRGVKVVPRSDIAAGFVRQFGLNVSSEPVSHGVDGRVFHPRKEKNRSFVVVAHLDKEKNVMSVLSAFKRFKEKYSDRYVLYVIGEGEEYGNLADYVRDNRLEKWIFFLGRISQKRLSYYVGSAACLLCNSRKEMNMLSLGEAVVSGTPVLTNTVPYNHKCIIENQLGIAKDDWTEEDMHEIVVNNPLYVNNCLRYASRLLLSELPDQFIKQLDME